jgi:hypothetical protein
VHNDCVVAWSGECIDPVRGRLEEQLSLSTIHLRLSKIVTLLFQGHQENVPVEQGQSRVDDHDTMVDVTAINHKVESLDSTIPVCQYMMDTGSRRTTVHGHILSLPRWLPFTDTIEGDHHGDHSRLDTVVFKIK